MDISARGLWGGGTRAFLDVRVYNPLALSYQNQSLSAAYCQNEKQKKREYNQRVIDVEHGSFTPLVFSCFGGMRKEYSVFYKRLAILICEKRDQPYYEISSFIRTRISFSLIRVAILCIRGCRSASELNERERISDIDIPMVVEDTGIRDRDIM